MPSQVFKTSTTWVVDFHYDGRPRRWLKAFGSDADAEGEMADGLQALYSGRAKLVEVRQATGNEEMAPARHRAGSQSHPALAVTTVPEDQGISNCYLTGYQPLRMTVADR